MVALSAWFDYVAVDVPGATLPVIEQQIREAARMFLEETELWHDTAADVSVAPGVGTMALTTAVSGAEVWRVHAAIAGDPLIPATEAMLDSYYGEKWRKGEPGKTRYTRMSIDRTTLHLYLTPVEGATITRTLIFRPTKTATTLPDWLYAQYEPAISHGAKGALFAMKRKPWSDPDAAAYHLSEFRRAKTAGSLSRVQGGNRAVLRTTPMFR